MKQLSYTVTDAGVVERLIEDEHHTLAHIVLKSGETLPEHASDSNATMIVVRGECTLRHDDQTAVCTAGSILLIPYRTHMQISNKGGSVLELFIVKVPSPKSIMAPM